MPATIHRNQRCNAVLAALPIDGKTKEGRTVAELLQLVGNHYKDCATEKARTRALQRDLKELASSEEVVTREIPGEGTKLYHWRAKHASRSFKKPFLRNLFQELRDLGIDDDLAADTVRRVQQPGSFFDLPAAQFIAVPDTIRLTPTAAPDETIRQEIIAALRKRRVLKASYQKLGEGSPSERLLHLIGVLQRGPQFYVIAYDEAKLALPQPPPQMYLLQRFADAVVLDDPARPPTNASLQDIAIQRSLADFVRDPEPVEVKLKVRDYVRRLLASNRLSRDQTIEPADEEDCAIVTARLPLSGTLYRWVLGFGDKVEVLVPESLRRTVASQAEAVADLYAEADDEDAEGD